MDNKFKYIKRLSVYLISFCVILLTMIFSTTGVHADANQEVVTINKICADGGTYFRGDTVSIYVYFSEPVAVSGKPYIATTVGNAVYTTGGGTNILKFDVTIPSIQSASKLNYTTSNSLVVDQNSSIRSMDNNLVDLVLPNMLEENSLTGSNVNLLPGIANLSVKIIRSTGEELSEGTCNLTVYESKDSGAYLISKYMVTVPAGKEFKLGGFEANREYKLMVSCEGNNVDLLPLPVSILTDGNGTPTTNDVIIKMPVVQVKFVVKTPNGQGLNERCWIWVSYPDGHSSGRITNNLGELNWGNLEDGDYIVNAVPDYTSEYSLSKSEKITIKDCALEKINDVTVTNANYSQGIGCNIVLTNPTLTGKVLIPTGDCFNYSDYSFNVSSMDNNGKYNPEKQYRLALTMDGKFKLGGFEANKKYFISVVYYGKSLDLCPASAIVTTDGNGIPTPNDIVIKLPNVQIKCVTILPSGDTCEENYFGVRVERLNGENVNISDKVCVYMGTRCSIYNLEDGEYRIWTSSPSSDYEASEKTLIKIENGILTEVNGEPVTSKICELKLREKPVVKLIVKTPDGQSLNEICDIYFLNSDCSRIKDKTNDRGELDWFDFRDCNYKVLAVPKSTSNYSVSSIQNIIIKNGKVEKVNGATVTDNVCDILLSNPTLTGKVLNSSGETLNNLDYNLIINSVDNDGYWQYQYELDVLGAKDFKLGGFEPNKTYEIWVNTFNSSINGDNYGDSEIEITTDENGIPTPNDIVIKLPKVQIKCVTILPSGDIFKDNCQYLNIEKLNGDYVSLYNKLSWNAWDAVSGSSIYNLEDGEYRIWTWSPSTDYVESEKKLIKIENGVLTEVNGVPATSKVCELRLNLPQVKFIVKTPDGQSLNERCDIYVRKCTTNSENMYASTDTLGKSSWRGLEDGDYVVTAVPNNASNYSASIMQKITIKNGKLEKVNGVDVTDNVCNMLLSNPTLEGNILSPTEGVLSDVDCSLYIYSVADTGSLEYQYTLNLQSYKNFKLGGFEANKEYIICAYPSLNSVNSNDYTPGGIEITTDENGNPKEKNVEIRLGEAQIKCIVSTWSGQTADFKNITLKVEKFNGSSYDDSRTYYSQQNGKCLLYALEDGEYRISAQYSGKDYISSENILVKIENGILTEVNGEPVTSNTYELKLREPQLIGTVTTPQGKAINESCSIEIVDLEGNSKSVLTNESGEYNVNELEDGEYTITAVVGYSNDYAASVPKKVTIREGKLVKINESDVTDKNCDLVLSNPSLTGSIVRTTGEPLEQGDCVLQVLEVDDLGNSKFQYSVMSSVYGGFKLGGFEPNKTYEIRGLVYGDPFFEIDGIKITTDNNGNPLQDNITMKARMPIMYVEAVDESDNIIKEDFEIKIEGIDALEVEKLLDGSYEIYDLADGTYTVWIQSKNSQSSFVSSKHTIEILNGSLIKVDGVDEASNTLKIKVQTLPNTNYVLGDVDGDGEITNADAELILKYAADLVTFTDQQKLTADVNGDGKVTAGDSTLIYRYVQKLIQQFPKVS